MLEEQQVSPKIKQGNRIRCNLGCEGAIVQNEGGRLL